MAVLALQGVLLANARTILTNQRLMCDYGGQWLSFWHDGVVEFQGDLAQWMFVLRYEVGSPLMLHGPAALARSVAQARAERQRTISGEVIDARSAGP